VDPNRETIEKINELKAPRLAPALPFLRFTYAGGSYADFIASASPNTR
jgi:hypothetical protein